VVIEICNGKSSSDVIEESFECSCDVGLREWSLDAVIEAVSKEIPCAGRGLGVGTEVVEPSVLYGLNVLCDGQVGNGKLFVSPEGEAGVGDKAIL